MSNVRQTHGTSPTLVARAKMYYPIAWHGMALNLPRSTTYHMMYSVPNGGILETFHVSMIYDSW